MLRTLIIRFPPCVTQAVKSFNETVVSFFISDKIKWKIYNVNEGWIGQRS